MHFYVCHFRKGEKYFICVLIKILARSQIWIKVIQPNDERQRKPEEAKLHWDVSGILTAWRSLSRGQLASLRHVCITSRILAAKTYNNVGQTFVIPVSSLSHQVRITLRPITGSFRSVCLVGTRTERTVFLQLSFHNY